MLPTNQSFHCNSNVEQFCFHAKETKCHMQLQHMLRTNDSSMRGQKWGLRAAIYVPGWEKYHFLVLFYLINNVPFPHYFPKSPADNLRWYSFSLRLTCAQPRMSRISLQEKTRFQGITIGKPLFARYIGFWSKEKNDVFIKWCRQIVLTNMNIEYSVTLKSPQGWCSSRVAFL